jgi:Na+/H+ antiporter NhaD/arsenite permease-like protein
MTYINAMTERNIFEALRSWLVRRGFSYRAVFWVTGWLAFFISPMADNMTTALIMCAVVMAVGAGNARFISLSCINIVVAANAGGAYSPFGDITTLMVWQEGFIHFFQFFWIFIPALANFAVPATIMHFALPKGVPHPDAAPVGMKPGARRVIALFFITLVITVAGHQVLHLPPVYGMLTGLSFLGFFGFYLNKKAHRMQSEELGMVVPFDIFRRVAEAEWDTLLFFYGVLMCVGGLATFGQLSLISNTLYGGLGATWANILIGLLSAVVDNIPVMYAVLTMMPDMHLGQWLLVTLTAGVGGSLLSIGSAAGVALMGQAKGTYTFFSHLKWSWAVALGYAASIIVHIWINEHLFHIPA